MFRTLTDPNVWVLVIVACSAVAWIADWQQQRDRRRLDETDRDG
jgi:hypothetical protein